MCMTNDKVTVLSEPERCYVIRQTRDCETKCIKSPFYYTKWEIGTKQTINDKNSLNLNQLVNLCNEVFHTFKTRKQARDVLREFKSRTKFDNNGFINTIHKSKKYDWTIFAAEGSGIKVEGSLHRFDDLYDGQPCVGYTELTLLKRA